MPSSTQHMVIEHPIQVKHGVRRKKTIGLPSGAGADQGHDQDPALGRAAMNAL